MKRDDRALVGDILLAARTIIRYLHRVTRRRFDSHRMMQDAVTRQISIIGEAANLLSNDFRRAHPGAPWRQIISMRNLVTHVYWNIDLDIVWNAAHANVPALAKYLEEIVKDEEG